MLKKTRTSKYVGLDPVLHMCGARMNGISTQIFELYQLRQEHKQDRQASLSSEYCSGFPKAIKGGEFNRAMQDYHNIKT